MTRVKLKGYQDSYAKAMAKYGLQRGIDGSEARHVTTQEFYRNAIAQQQVEARTAVFSSLQVSKRETISGPQRKVQK